nr:hypothetical protein [uncultured Olsenella sp.]
MTGREWWGSVRDAASQIGAAEARLAALREPRGSGGHGVGSGIGDPTGRWAVQLAEAEASETKVVRALEQVVGDGLAACHRIGVIMDSQAAALVMESYYVDCLTWDKVADRAHVSRGTAIGIRKRAVELTDEVGIAHLVHGWACPE